MFKELQILDIVLDIAAILLHLILCPLIVYKSSSHMATYRFLLLALVICELFFAVTLLLAVPSYQTTSNGWIFYATSNFLSNKAAVWTLIACVFLYSVIAALFAYSFIYRYAVTCKDSSEKILSWYRDPWRIGLLLFGLICLNIIFGILIGKYFTPTEEFTLELLKDFHDIGVNLTEIAYVGAQIHSSDGSLVPGTLITLGSFFIFWIVDSYIYAFAAIRITKKLRSRDIQSPTMLANQKRLFTLLILQTVSPIMFTFVPAICGFILAVFGINSGSMAQFYSLTLPFSTVLDPILIFIFIKEYRLAVKNFLMCRTKPSNARVSATTQDTRQFSNISRNA